MIDWYGANSTMPLLLSTIQSTDYKYYTPQYQADIAACGSDASDVIYHNHYVRGSVWKVDIAVIADGQRIDGSLYLDAR